MSVVKTYPTYSAMIADQNPGDRAVISSTGARFVRIENHWVCNFINQSNSAIDYGDFTAFDVYASDKDFTTTTKAKDIDDDFIPIIFRKQKSELTESELDSTPIKNNIVANKTHVMLVNTSCGHNGNDIVIDWGDGDFLDLRNVYDESTHTITNPAVLSASVYSDGSVAYKVTHTYAAKGIYRISIYGKKYWRIDHSVSGTDCLLCRVFSPELPIASCFVNLSSYCNTCRRLFDVDDAYYCTGLRQRIDNFSGTFTNCFNLKRVNWFPYTNYVVQGVPKIFYNCQNLTSINYTLPTHFESSMQGIKSAFGWCKNLAVDISTLFSTEKFQNKVIDVGELFRRCAKLTGTVPADKLWDDTSITWLNTSTAFEGCSAAIRAQVPVSWGGTASDDIIGASEKHMKVNIDAPLQVSAGTTTLALTERYDSYTVKPTAATNINIDVSGLEGITGADFRIVIDMSDGVQTVTFPENVVFIGGTVPEMSRKGYYIIKMSYSSFGEGGFFGEYIGVTTGPIDLTKGIWYWADGESTPSVYEGQEYLPNADFSGGTMHVQPGSVIGSLQANEAYDGEWYGKNALCIVAGTVGSLYITDSGDGRGDYDITAIVDGGTVSSARLDPSNSNLLLKVENGFVGNTKISMPRSSAILNGGTISFIEIESSCLTVNGGVVGGVNGSCTEPDITTNLIVNDGLVLGTITRGSWFGVVVTGGTVEAIGRSWDSSRLNITGGTIGSITENYYDGTISVGGTAVVGTVTLGDDDSSNEYGSRLIVSDNALVKRVVSNYHIDEAMGIVKKGITISGGTVGVTPRLKSEIEAGMVALNITGGTVIYLDS